MNSQEFERFVCWKDYRINQVINTEAVAIDKANFLATHTPFKRIKYAHVVHQIQDTSEDSFLEELREQSSKNQHVFAVIQGIPGTGKSHLIRWLKEKYQQFSKDDAILLVERANSSLLGTLRQVIESGVFDPETMMEELNRIKGAADELSSNALDDSILNNLQIATHEVQLPLEKEPPKKIRRNIEYFLLDANIRKWLKREKGPIDRIRRHISSGKQVGLDDDELPGFDSSDFDVPVELLHSIRDFGGHENARTLANLLNDDGEIELRKSLADYLNRLLNFAIGHTTALSAEDLKQIFNQLRRNLRKQNKNLVLFIEDITAFTGIDAGLIDVLATQHTGEGNREFCRLISVIGITDDYYWSRFPDNLRDRITHRLTLNKDIDSTSSESDLLQTPDAASDMVGRYMNALRVDADVLKRWADDGSEIRSMPNPCYECPFRTVCHQSFGFVNLIDETTNERWNVGLYPFNKNAIWQMYQGISVKNVARTPRSLLRSIVQYVLQSHGAKIKVGKFPPPRNEVGSDFKPPLLVDPSQLRIIQEQGKQDAPRIESLVLFWGNRTININEVSGYIGGLPPDVYKAFSISVIQGQSGNDDIVPTPELPISQPTPPPPSQIDPRVEDIRNWLDGERLNYYEDYARWLAIQIEGFYDWEIHGISRPQVKERVKVAKLVFEGQFGKITSRDNFLIERNRDSFFLLNALCDLNTHLESLDPSKIGSHLTTMSSWLRKQESRIIQYVKKPSSFNSEISLDYIVFWNNLCFAVLDGSFDSEPVTNFTIYKNLIQASRKNNWADLPNQLRDLRNQDWINLIKRLPFDGVKSCREQWLQQINLPQGTSTDVRFIDAAKVLDQIDEAKEKDWSLPQVDLPSEGDYILWDRFDQLYRELQIAYEKVLEEEYLAMRSLLQELKTLMGDSGAVEVFQAISSMLAALRDNSIGYSFQERQDLNADQLIAIKDYIAGITTLEKNYERKIKLSIGKQVIRNLKANILYMNEFAKLASNFEQSLVKEVKELKSIQQNEHLIHQAEKLYEEIERTLLETTKIANLGDESQ